MHVYTFKPVVDVYVYANVRISVCRPSFCSHITSLVTTNTIKRRVFSECYGVTNITSAASILLGTEHSVSCEANATNETTGDIWWSASETGTPKIRCGATCQITHLLQPRSNVFYCFVNVSGCVDREQTEVNVYWGRFYRVEVVNARGR